MSTFNSDPQFGRGQTLGGRSGTTTLTASDGTTVVGFQKTFLDQDPKTSESLSNRQVQCIALRNSTGGTLAAGDVVTFLLGDATAKAVPTDAQAAVVDEYLPGTVAVNDVFWAVIQGPTKVKIATGTVASGTKVVLGTAGNAGAAIAGTGLGVCLGAKNAANLARAVVGLQASSAHVTSAT